MTVTYNNNQTDYKNFLYYTALFQERKIRNILIFGVMFAVFFISAFTLIMCRIYKAGSFFSYLAVGFLAITLFNLAKVIVAVKRSVKNIHRTSPDFLLITNTYTFTEDGLTVSSKHQKKKKPQITELDYSSLLKGVERKDIVYLYLYPNVAIMFKKSALDGDATELITLLKTKMGDKFKCKSKINAQK